MDSEADNEFEEHFDIESDDEDVGDKSTTTHAEPTHPDMTEIAQLIEDALNPLRGSVETMTEAYTEEPQGYERLSELINERSKSLHHEINKLIKEPTPDPLQPQDAMLQPRDGQILPASVSHVTVRSYRHPLEMRSTACTRLRRHTKYQSVRSVHLIISSTTTQF